MTGNPRNKTCGHCPQQVLTMLTCKHSLHVLLDLAVDGLLLLSRTDNLLRRRVGPPPWRYVVVTQDQIGSVLWKMNSKTIIL